jgi:hypothetical protein
MGGKRIFWRTFIHSGGGIELMCEYLKVIVFPFFFPFLEQVLEWHSIISFGGNSEGHWVNAPAAPKISLQGEIKQETQWHRPNKYIQTIRNSKSPCACCV